ncbi:uncharacterized protein LOC110988008 [Acanthaster planci]|uniref:Uncharacterized protein LOC110988008 n=1 Tax=Acanthaster planci TaxID=133434 RepID=A0A8B7ZTW3_ACAPL|nr:uncharacterized protein LOC110988008 [Acanthaster planci]
MDFYYYHDFTSPELQKKVLHQQIQLALKYNLPVLLHIREAYLDTIAIVKQYPQLRGIVHCFSGYLDDALVPVPYRGKINLPGYIQHTVSKLATIKNMAVKEVIKITTQNAQTVFKLK